MEKIQFELKSNYIENGENKERMETRKTSWMNAIINEITDLIDYEYFVVLEIYKNGYKSKEYIEEICEINELKFEVLKEFVCYYHEHIKEKPEYAIGFDFEIKITSSDNIITTLSIK